MLVAISYDLKQPEKDYAQLYDAIKGLGDQWWHYLESTWLVHTELTVEECSNRIRQAMDKDDFLLIINVTSCDYQGWLPSKAWEWIKTNNR